MTTAEFQAALESGPYAWPGGYPLYFATLDGAALSFAAAKEERAQIIESIQSRLNDGWRVVCVAVNWEDSTLMCDHTGELIESAYGESE